ncbi:MAG: HD domain-containing protein [Bacilli bacterium]
MTKIKDFHPTDDATLVLRLHDVQIKKTNAGADYASMLGFDGSDTIEVKIWAFTDDIRDKLTAGEVYVASGRMKEYQGKMQFNITDLRQIGDDEDIDLHEFYEYAVMDVATLQQHIEQYIEKIADPTLKKITIAIIKKHYVNFFSYPAAVNMHHNYFHGLAYHTYSMLTLSDAYLKLYPYLNASLVISGILLHDIGKVIELSGPKGTEYTKIGKLLGHINIGASEVLQTASEMGLPQCEAALALTHIILSHHGQLEYGSPKEPIIPEAALVHFLDLSDSKLAALEKEASKTPPGTFTNPILSFDRRSFYIPDLENKK